VSVRPPGSALAGLLATDLCTCACKLGWGSQSGSSPLAVWMNLVAKKLVEFEVVVAEASECECRLCWPSAGCACKAWLLAMSDASRKCETNGPALRG
jgi:hypothetical protein